jgi:hypothetical protein
MIGAATAAGLVVVAVVLVASEVLDVPADTFTRDPAALAPVLPFYGGSVSLLNSVVWGSTATAAFLAAWVGPARYRLGMGVLGVLALLLLADDALMVHELLAPRVGIPEELVYGVHAALAAAVVWLLRRDLRSPVVAALVVAGVWLAVSVGIDKLVDEAPLVLLAEDGTKLVGTLVLLTVPVLALAGLRRAAPTDPGARAGATPVGGTAPDVVGPAAPADPPAPADPAAPPAPADVVAARAGAAAR